MANHSTSCLMGHIDAGVKTLFGAMGMDIYEVYGLTECTGVCNSTLPARTTPGAVGPPLPGCEVAIADLRELALFHCKSFFCSDLRGFCSGSMGRISFGRGFG